MYRFTGLLGLERTPLMHTTTGMKVGVSGKTQRFKIHRVKA